MHKDVLRLAALLAGVALATSRIGLIGHELVGHGGAALAMGARILDIQMFWFAGGWIRYQLPGATLPAAVAIAMAGIALELVVGLGLWLGVRGHSLGRRLVRCVGAVLVVHATWYLATGAFHGFGDGLVLYRALGDARVFVAILAGVITCVAAYLAAQRVVGVLTATLPGTARARIAGMIAAALLAGGLHAALAAGELALRRDPTYAATMAPERDRVIARELKAWQREQLARGIQPDESARRVQRARLAKQHETFPFVWLLALATVLSVIAGAVRAREVEDAPIPRRTLRLAIAIAIASIVAVIAIDLVIDRLLAL